MDHIYPFKAKIPLPGANQSGFTLVSVMVAAAISVAVAASLASVATRAFSTQRHVELRGSLEDIRRQLRVEVSCDAIFGNRSQSAICNAPIELRSRNGRLVTGPLATSGRATGSGKIGPWNVRAECDAAGRGIVVRAARISAQDKFLRDPMTGKELDFGERSASGGNPIGFLCAERFLSASADPSFCTFGRAVQDGRCDTTRGEFLTSVDPADGRACCTSVSSYIRTYIARNDGGDIYKINQDRKTVSCDPGDRVLGGGGNGPRCDFGTEGACSATGYVDRDSYPQDTRTWVNYIDLNQEAKGDATSTIAVCLDLPPFR